MLRKTLLSSRTDRDDDVSIITILCWMVICAILPFGIYRVLQQEWPIAAADLAVCVLLLGLIAYMRSIGRSYLPKLLFSTICLSMMNITIFLNGKSQLFWCFPTVMSVFYLLPPRVAFWLSAVGLLVLFAILNSITPLQGEMTTVITVLLTLFVSLAFSFNKQSQQEKLKLMAVKDPLTGLGNRLALDTQLTHSISVSQRFKQPISVVLFDIDHFKKINDNYGHDIGDEVLKKFSRLFTRRIRNADSLFRFGGEEFLLIAEASDLESAGKVAEELRMLLESSELVDGLKVTTSAGVAEFEAGQTIEHWLKRADDALYKAKNSGRNQISLAV